MVLTDDEKKVTAFHEAGHALVAAFQPGHDPLHKVTIIPRGRALGVTMQLPTEDKYTYTKGFVGNQIAILMGGRVAEELTQRDITTGAGNDIERATAMARRWSANGACRSSGPLAFGGARRAGLPGPRLRAARQLQRGDRAEDRRGGPAHRPARLRDGARDPLRPTAPCSTVWPSSCSSTSRSTARRSTGSSRR